MSVAETSAALGRIFPKLYKLSAEKQAKRVQKGKFRFSWYDFQDGLRPVINERVSKEDRMMLDTQSRACKTSVYSIHNFKVIVDSIPTVL